MKKVLTTLVIVLLLSMSLVLVACNPTKAEVVITFDEKNLKTTYTLGEEISLGGATFVYTQGEKVTETLVTAADVRGYDKTKLGMQKITFTTKDAFKTYRNVYVTRQPAVDVDIEMYVNQVVSYDEGSSVASLTPEYIKVVGNEAQVIKATEENAKAILLVIDTATNESVRQMVTISATLPLDIAIRNYNGVAIEAWDNNIYAFTVSADKEAIVKVDGNVIESSTGTSEYGKHIVTVAKEDASYDFAININKPDSVGNNYDIVATYATLPTLYAALDMAQNTNGKFIWFGRAGTLDIGHLGKMDDVTVSKYIGDHEKLAVNVVAEIKAYCYAILESDPNAHFNLYVDDFRHWIEITTLVEMGINTDRYNVNYCSDGMYTYYKAYSYKNGTLDTYNKVVNDRNTMVNNARANKYAADATDRYMNNGISDGYDFNDDFILAGAALNHISYWAQYPEYVYSTNSDIQEIFHTAIDKRLPELMYSKLSTTQEKAFLNMAGFDKEAFAKAYFSKDNGKEYLVMTGTNTKDDCAKQMPELRLAINKYKDTYNLVFKPHPSCPPAGDAAAEIAAAGVTVLPGKLPMEIILFTFPMLKTGGYSSSLYMSAPKGNTIFFFARGKENLITPIVDLFDALFYNAEFLFIS